MRRLALFVRLRISRDRPASGESGYGGTLRDGETERAPMGR
jgi:hypothetical protein